MHLPERSASRASLYLESLELFGMRFGLDRMRRLMTALGTPQESFRSIHVTGSNGKTSTTRMIAALLVGHGVRTGAYMSPHLVSWSERIEIGGRAVADAAFDAAVERVADAAALVERTLEPGDHVTQFEALTAAAYLELARAGVAVAVVEAGLGGRYDATSVIRSDVQVLTNVSLEHTRWLGPTETHIAEEKVAVLPEGGTLVAGRLSREALAVAERTAAARGARLLLLGRDFGDPGVPLGPRGEFQRENFAVAVAAAEAFHGRLDPARVRDAAASVRTPGRLEVVGRRPLVVVDGAHNPAGARALAAALPGITAGRAVVGVMSVLDDKAAAEMLAVLLPLMDRVVFTRSSNRGALPAATLESLARQVAPTPVLLEQAPRAALARARDVAGPDGAVLVTGSIYLLSDLARAGVLGER